MSTNEKLKRMIDWLCANQLASNQTDVARRAGISSVNVSRIMAGHVKNTTLETLNKVNVAFGSPFNPFWLRDKSDVMLSEDVTSDNMATKTEQPSPTPPDLTVQLLAAKDETIAALRQQLADKDNIIAAKDALISNLQQQLAVAQMQTALEKGLSDGSPKHTPVDLEPQPRAAR